MSYDHNKWVPVHLRPQEYYRKLYEEQFEDSDFETAAEFCEYMKGVDRREAERLNKLLRNRPFLKGVPLECRTRHFYRQLYDKGHIDAHLYSSFDHFHDVMSKQDYSEVANKLKAQSVICMMKDKYKDRLSPSYVLTGTEERKDTPIIALKPTQGRMAGSDYIGAFDSKWRMADFGVSYLYNDDAYIIIQPPIPKDNLHKLRDYLGGPESASWFLSCVEPYKKIQVKHLLDLPIPEGIL